jgi:hypothetical protein
MLKFRALTAAELAELEIEFKQFLIVNELYDAEWRELATKNPQKAQEFIDTFANIVLEKVYNQLPGLLHIGLDFITVFDFQDEVWNLYHLQTDTEGILSDCMPDDFITPIKNNWSQFHLQIGTKKSSEQKAQEVHTLICKGAVPLHPTILQDFLKLLQSN